MDSTPAFVQAVEVWTPDGNLLHRHSGAYGELTEFALASADITLEKGRGLPGAAYKSMRPEVWHELGAGFVRQQSARLSGLSAAVALPWFRGNSLSSVVVFLCGSRERTGGCIEVWEQGEQKMLAHADGYYGRLATFEDVSRVMRFPRGQGLPGIVWERGMPHIMEDLATSSSFMRASAARESGVTSGLGVPLFVGSQVEFVVTLLSAASTPLARAFEIWVPDAAGQLSLQQSYYAPGLSALGEETRSVSFSAAVDVPGLVSGTELPWAVSCVEPARPFLRAALGRDLGLHFAVGLPVHDGDQLRAVVVMFC
ncbi:MAG TPA: hypothetical protein VFZ61_34350 [Polyangiales bacterium]